MEKQGAMDSAALNPEDRAKPDLELLDECGRLRALARHLCQGDVDRAEDLVQDTCRLALRDRPAPFSKGLGAWCRGVLRNRFRERARREKRGRYREQAVARERPEIVHDEAQARCERAELLERLVAHVLALDARYRDVLLQRYFEDRPFDQIAARDAIPLETIRTRHRRALHTLRRRLDAESGGDRSRWILGLMLATGLWQTRAVATGSTSAAITASITWGAFAMKKMICACALALLLLGGGIAWIFWTGESRRPVDDRLSRSASEELRGESASTDETPQHRSSPSLVISGESIPAEPAPKTPPARVIGVVRDWAGAPLDDVRVEAALVKKPDHFSPEVQVVVAQASTNEDGEFELGGLDAGTYFVRAIGHTQRPVQIKNLLLAAGDERWIEIRMTRGLEITGRVVADSGAPIAGATVETTPDFEQYGTVVYGSAGKSRDWTREELRETTAADGTFRLSRLGSGNHRIVARHPDWVSTVVPMVAASSEGLTIVMARGSVVRGHVMDATDAPVEAARLTLELYDESFISGKQWRRHLKTTSDADGRFAFQNASSGRSILEVSAKDLPERVLEVVVPETGSPPIELEVRLGAGATLRGRVVAGDGTGVSEAEIRIESIAGPVVRQDTLSAEDGTFLFEGLERGLEYRIALRDSRFRSPEALNVHVIDEHTDVGEVSLERGLSLHGRVVTAPGHEPVAGVDVQLEHDRSGNSSWRVSGKSTKSGLDGSFEFSGLKEHTYRVVVEATGWGIARSDWVSLTTGEDVPEVTVAFGDGPKLSGRVVDDQGAPLAGARVLISENGQGDVATWSDRQGHFLFQHVESGGLGIRAELGTLKSKKPSSSSP